MHFCMAKPFSYWEAQSLTQYSKCGLTNARHRGIITFFELLARFVVGWFSKSITQWRTGDSCSNCCLEDQKVTFLKAAFYTNSPMPVQVQRVIPPQVQEFVFAFFFVELCEVPVNQFLQLVILSERLCCLPACWLLPQLGIIHELAKVAFCPFDQVINRNLKQHLPYWVPDYYHA